MGTMRKHASEWVWAYLLLAPSLILFVVFVLWPVGKTFVMSAYEWNMLTPPKFIGLENYRTLVHDSRLGVILRNTLYFTLIAVILKVLLGLLVAMLVGSVKRKFFSSILESAFFFPIILPMSVITMVWGILLNTDSGMVNGMLSYLGMDKIPWLTDGTWALRTIILLDAWKGIGFFFIIFLVALRNVPKDFYEAAEIDGAGKWTRFLRITLPFISPTSFFLIVTAIIGSLQVFDQAYILTRGGPGDSTRTIVYYLWENAFQLMNMGYGTTLALLLFVFILLVTIAQFVLSKRWVFYE